MTNPTLNNEIDNTEVILWQYDKAWNLIRLIENWNQWAKVSCQDFWDRFMGNMGSFKNSGTFTIDCADTFGLNVWGNMLGIPRPMIKIETGSDGKADIITLPASGGTVVSGYNKYGFNAEGYKVLAVEDGWKTVTITNDLYRRLLKARFFMMNHKPTVPNYNKFLAILWGAMENQVVELDTKKVFNEDGVANTNVYTSRARVFDFQNMTMGFSFPIDATIEESYLIFQHYDIVYPFPAGIRYPGEFILDDLVIGLNTDQIEESDTTGNDDSIDIDADVSDDESSSAAIQDSIEYSNQNYKNFVNGVVMVEMVDSDKNTNPNGGIFSTTERANYNIPPRVGGKAYILPVSNDVGNLTLTIKRISGAPKATEKIWIDWGDGTCNYYYLVKPVETANINKHYNKSGLYAVIVRYDTGIIETTSEPNNIVSYTLSGLEG